MAIVPRMQYLWEFVRAIGGWWFWAVALLLDVAGAVAFDLRSLPAWGIGVSFFLLFLYGASKAYAKVAQERDGLLALLDAEGPKFKIKAGLPSRGDFNSHPILRIPGAYLVNRTHTAIQLRFTLVASDGSWSLESEPYNSAGRDAGSPDGFFPNPVHLKPRSNRGRDLAWFSKGLPSPYKTEGTVLHVLEEQSDVEVDIPLPTARDGFVYPRDTTSGP